MKQQMKWMAVAMALATGSVIAAPTASFQVGVTTVAADAGFLAAAKNLNVAVTPIKGKKLRFNIVAGSIDLANAKSEILHDGGIKLKTSTTVVELRNFIIDTTGERPVLTGLVVANEGTVGRLPLFDLVLPAGLTLPLKAKGSLKSLTLAGVSLKLTAGAATALNSAFSVTAFTEGLPIGVAKVRAFGLKN